MKHIILAAALLAAAAGAGAQIGQARGVPRPPVEVQVSDGRISLSEPTLRVSAGPALLSWLLVSPGYRFTGSSLNFGGAQGYFSCTTFNNGAGLRCSKSADAPAGQMRYSIVLTPEPGSAPVEQTNPIIWVAND